MSEFTKRKLLITTVSVMFVIGVTVAIVISMGSMWPSEKIASDIDEMDPKEVDVSGLKIGEYKVVEWRKRPVLILRRDPEDVKKLAELNQDMFDPLSKIDFDPHYIKPIQRSIYPEYFVGINISTYCGCSLNYEKKSWGRWNLPGGLFFDPCHIGTYDSAGRLLKKTAVKPNPACGRDRMSNMKIPPHKFISRDVVVIGLES